MCPLLYMSKLISYNIPEAVFPHSTNEELVLAHHRHTKKLDQASFLAELGLRCRQSSSGIYALYSSSEFSPWPCRLLGTTGQFTEPLCDDSSGSAAVNGHSPSL